MRRHVIRAGRVHVELEGAAVDGRRVVGDVEAVEAQLGGLVEQGHRPVLVVEDLWAVLLAARGRDLRCTKGRVEVVVSSRGSLDITRFH